MIDGYQDKQRDAGCCSRAALKSPDNRDHKRKKQIGIPLGGDRPGWPIDDDIVEPWRLNKEQRCDQLRLVRYAGRHIELSNGVLQYINSGREQSGGVYAAKARPEKPADRRPVPVGGEPVAIDMREDEAAEYEKQIDGKISPATDPGRSAAAKMVGEKTAVIEQNRHGRDPAQRGKRRQLPPCVRAAACSRASQPRTGYRRQNAS